MSHEIPLFAPIEFSRFYSVSDCLFHYAEGYLAFGSERYVITQVQNGEYHFQKQERFENIIVTIIKVFSYIATFFILPIAAHLIKIRCRSQYKLVEPPPAYAPPRQPAPLPPPASLPPVAPVPTAPHSPPQTRPSPPTPPRPTAPQKPVYPPVYPPPQQGEPPQPSAPLADDEVVPPVRLVKRSQGARPNIPIGYDKDPRAPTLTQRGHEITGVEIDAILEHGGNGVTSPFLSEAILAAATKGVRVTQEHIDKIQRVVDVIVEAEGKQRGAAVTNSGELLRAFPSYLDQFFQTRSSDGNWNQAANKLLAELGLPADANYFDPNMVALIIVGFCFNVKWLYKFDTNNTVKAPWRLTELSNAATRVSMMVEKEYDGGRDRERAIRKGLTFVPKFVFHQSESEPVSILAIPAKVYEKTSGRIWQITVLPNEFSDKGMQAAKRFVSNHWEEIVIAIRREKNATEKYSIVALPCTKNKGKIDLPDGDPSIQFFNRSDLAIQYDIRYSVDANEEGAEVKVAKAARAIAMGAGGSSDDEENEICFVANRPCIQVYQAISGDTVCPPMAVHVISDASKLEDSSKAPSARDFDGLPTTTITGTSNGFWTSSSSPDDDDTYDVFD